MAEPDLKQWADALIDKPINLADDWGNLLLSTGVAFQQKPQESLGLTSTANHNSTYEHSESRDVLVGESVQPRKVSESGLQGRDYCIGSAFVDSTRRSRHVCQ